MPAALPAECEDVALIDEEHPRVNRQEGIAASQFVAFRPVGGGTPAVEQSRFGQHERSPAHRKDATPSGVRLPQCFEHVF